MAIAQNRKYLKFTLSIGWISLFTMLLLSWPVLFGYFKGNSTTGVVADKKIYMEHVRGVNGPKSVQLHEITVEYMVYGERYWTLANAHMYSGMGLIKEGDNMTVVYDPGEPSKSEVLSYWLFSPMASIFGYIAFVCLLVGLPRWWKWRKNLKEKVC